MKLKSIINGIVAVALTIVTISCQKEKVGEKIDSTITVSSGKILNVSSGSSSFEIMYKVEGAGEGAAVAAVSDQDWVTFEENLAPGIVKAAIAENLSTGDRTARITLSLKGAKDVYVTVLQAANPDYKVDKSLTFDLDVTDITSTSVTLTVSPSKQDSYYYHAIVKAETVEAFKSDKEFIDDYVGQIVDYEMKKNPDNWTIKNQLTKGFASYEVKGLPVDTEMYLIAFDLTLGAESSGVLTKKKFSTKPMTPSSWEFNIKVDENARVTVIPHRSFSGKYALEVVSLSMWERDGGPAGSAESFIQWVKSSDYSMSSFMHEGEYSALYYNPNAQSGNISTGDYVAFAFGTDGAKVTSGVSYVHFHFEEPVK